MQNTDITSLHGKEFIFNPIQCLYKIIKAKFIQIQSKIRNKWILNTEQQAEKASKSLQKHGVCDVVGCSSQWSLRMMVVQHNGCSA